jgi:hypothetical protein
MSFHMPIYHIQIGEDLVTIIEYNIILSSAFSEFEGGQNLFLAHMMSS